MEQQALWYVAHTYSGYENKVAQDLLTMVENRNLQERICDVKIPTETVIEDKLDRLGNVIGQKEVQHKIYPGYVFVKMVMDDETWYIVRNTRGCTGFVGPGGKPEALSEAEVAKMGVEIISMPQVDFAVGDNVEIVAGPMEGFTGLVESIDNENRRVKLKVSMFGRETDAELDIAQVKIL